MGSVICERWALGIQKDWETGMLLFHVAVDQRADALLLDERDLAAPEY